MDTAAFDIRVSCECGQRLQIIKGDMAAGKFEVEVAHCTKCCEEQYMTGRNDGIESLDGLHDRLGKEE